jgi:putative toxin-antitoxin system antitoxin component (TIGR02293 family)
MTNLAATPNQSPIYRAVVSDARAALSIAEIADVTGVQPRSVQNWASGNTRPEGPQRDRLLELSYVIEQVADVFESEGIEIWLHRPQRALQHRSPVDALREGDFTEVLGLIERLAGGPRR